MKKILAIDDEAAILRCFDEALKFRGYDVQTTTDAEAGLKLACEDPTIDLILLDVRMPGLNGFEFYHRLRDAREVPVLFITAYPRSFNSDDEDVAHLWMDHFAEGTTDILYKPFELSMLFEKVDGLIGPAKGGAETGNEADPE